MGLAVITDDRRLKGLSLALSVAENLVTKSYRTRPVSRHGWLRPRVTARLAADRPDLAFLYGQIAGLNRPLDQILTSGLGNERTPDDLRGLTVPTLWIVGSEDPLMPPVAMREAHRLTLRSEYFEVAETGHSVYFERAPQFNTRVRKFLSDQGWG